MGENAEKDRLLGTLHSHLNAIHETFQIFDQAPASTLKKVSWDDAAKMGDQVSKQATIVGMLWTGKEPQATEVKESMESYFNVLVGFLLLSHGSTVGAGPTLSSFILQAVKKIVDCSYKLIKDAIVSLGTGKENESSIPQLVGAVWEACSALKKIPTTNVAAIGRVMTQVAVSMKDVLREMKELKPGSTDTTDENAESEAQDDDGFNEDDLGSDLSPEEMKVARSAIVVVSEALVLVKELMRSITGLLKLESRDDTGDFVDSLEKLLKHCQGIGTEIDELGASLYPPQEVAIMKGAVEKISSMVDDMEREIESLKGTSDAFIQACGGLKSSLAQLKSEIDCSGPSDLATRVQMLI
ncbi:hypothetical protein L484_025856 [Morus notabilis]|uniref:Cyclin-D1-binding protein 1-like protein n=1 Tax=Morus notabilis TaxID=981085 RepID=W9RD38_9ROSA|nr:uncharacterized protein LOC21408538 [Morus notabilis]EXB65590.1 hypothetical protein L484_025856 [Morus notabilis]